MFEKKCKKMIAVHTLAAALVLTAATSLDAETVPFARFGAESRDLDVHHAETVVVDFSGPALIRFEWDRDAHLVPDADAASIRTLDRSPRGLLVAVEEAGSYAFRFDAEAGPEGTPELTEPVAELVISRLEADISRRSFWMDLDAGRVAVEHTIYRVTRASCLKNEEDETDPDPPSPGGLVAGPGGDGYDESACLKNEEDETDPDPPSQGGLTAGGEGSVAASYIEVRSGSSIDAERLLAVAVSSNSWARDRAFFARLGAARLAAEGATWTALISRPISVSAPARGAASARKFPAQTWRALVAGEDMDRQGRPWDELDGQLAVAAWTAPLVFPALPDFGEKRLRLLSLEPLAD